MIFSSILGSLNINCPFPTNTWVHTMSKRREYLLPDGDDDLRRQLWASTDWRWQWKIFVWMECINRITAKGCCNPITATMKFFQLEMAQVTIRIVCQVLKQTWMWEYKVFFISCSTINPLTCVPTLQQVRLMAP